MRSEHNELTLLPAIEGAFKNCGIAHKSMHQPLEFLQQPISG